MTPTASFPLRRIRDFSMRISDTIQFIKEHWTDLLRLYFIFIVPLILLATLLGAGGLSDLLTRVGDDFDSFGTALKKNGLSVGFALLLYLISGIAYPTLVYIYMRLFEEKGGVSPSISECAQLLVSKGMSNLGYGVLTLVALLLSVIVAVIPFFGILAFMVFFVYAMVTLTLLFPVNTIEDRSFPEAFQRSFYLIRDRWWNSFGYVIVLFLIYSFFGGVISLISSTIFGLASVNFLDPKPANDMFTQKYFLVTGLSSIIQQIFYLLVHVGLGIHYFSLREEKDGSGLEARLDQLGSDRFGTGDREEQY